MTSKKSLDKKFSESDPVKEAVEKTLSQDLSAPATLPASLKPSPKPSTKASQKPAPVPAPEPVDMNKKAEQFVAEYKALCEKYDMQLAAEPSFRMSRDTGLYSLEIIVMVRPLHE